jgi:hypothetical protein
VYQSRSSTKKEARADNASDTTTKRVSGTYALSKWSLNKRSGIFRAQQRRTDLIIAMCLFFSCLRNSVPCPFRPRSCRSTSLKEADLVSWELSVLISLLDMKSEDEEGELPVQY